MIKDINKIWNYFDRKTIMYFTGYKDTRVPRMEKELDRVGLSDAHRLWQFPTPLVKTMLRSIKNDGIIGKLGYFNASMAHYRAIATSYYLGCENALFMEDDIRFLNDLEEVKNAIDNIPAEYDIALLDPSIRDFSPWNDGPRYVQWRDGRKANEYWSEFDRMFSFGCYCLSRRGMEKIMGCYEAVETNPRIGKLRVCDHYLDRGILGNDTKMYFARKNVCIQSEIGTSTSNLDVITNRYVNIMGLNLDDYAPA